MIKRLIFQEDAFIVITPPCVRGCPFGALTKQLEGNSVINDRLCFGGAKCRDVCPWHIPQRQAGDGMKK